MENRLQRILTSHPTATTAAFAVVPSLFALGPSPSLVPLVLTIASLRIYSRVINQQESTLTPTLWLWLSLTVSTAVTFISPSLSALSSSVSTVIYLLLISSLTSALALVPVFLDTSLRFRFSMTSAAQAFLFPALWSTTWCLVSHVSPLGRLLTWSPVQGLDAYTWVRPYFGPVGIDWVVGAWAVVLSEVAGTWIVQSSVSKPQVGRLLSIASLDTDTTPQDAQVISSRPPANIGMLVCLLGLFTIPSFASLNLPYPVNSPETYSISVACVLPITKDGVPTIDDYLAESSRLNRAQIILWPENAGRLASQLEKTAAFNKIQNKTQGHHLIVAGFEGHTTSFSSTRPGMYDNGLVMITKEEGVVMEYHKRHLVPSKSFILLLSF